MNIEILHKIRTFVLKSDPKNPEKVKKAIRDLTIAKRYFSQLYDAGNSPLTDDEYDLLVIDSLKTLNPQALSLKETGADSTGSLVKEKLPMPCGSLECIKPGDGALETWIQSGSSSSHRSYVITQKLDGLTTLLEYTNGVLTNAHKRGNGVVGQVVLRHVKLMNIPQTLVDAPEYMLIRGEAVMKEATFTAKYKRPEDVETFKTSRNMVAGQFTREDPDPQIMQDIDLVCYEIKQPARDKDIQLYLLKSFGFKVASNVVRPCFSENTLKTLLVDMRAESEYLMDGIVIDINSSEEREALGFETNSYDPKYARSFKVPLEENMHNATVVDIEWNVSKNGLVKPRLVLDPYLDATGVTISHCNGKNGRLIKALGIGPGAIIKVIRSGDVIPDLLMVEKAVTPAIPTTCPSCGVVLKWTMDKNNDEVDLFCSNEDCEGRACKRILAFFTGIEAEGFNKGTAQKMVDAGYDIEGILRMPVEDIKALDGFGEMSATKLYTSIKDACAGVDLPTIMHATGMFGRSLGSTKLGIIVDAYGIEKLFDLCYGHILNLQGFSEITASAFKAGLPKFQGWWVNNKHFFKLQSKPKVEVESTKLAGQVILFTGFRDSELEAGIKANGGAVASGVSSKFTILVAKDTSKSSGKLDKARAMGIKVMSKGEFENFIG